MNYDEIENAVKCAKNGDSESLTSLLMQFKPFIFKTAKSFNIKDFDEYDLVQIGYISLIHAVDIYNPEKHSFSSYAYSAIKNSMKYTARSNKKHQSILSINASIDNDSSYDFTEFLKSNTHIEEDFLHQEKISELKKIISELPEDEFELIFLVYYNNFSLKDYATKKQQPYHKIVQKKNLILNKIRFKMSA